VNALGGEIAALNSEIMKVQALGDNPNDLMDRRDKLVSELSGIVDITVTYNDPGEMVVTTGGMHLVQGKHHESLALEADAANDGYSRIVWDDTAARPSSAAERSPRWWSCATGTPATRSSRSTLPP